MDACIGVEVSWLILWKLICIPWLCNFFVSSTMLSGPIPAIAFASARQISIARCSGNSNQPIWPPLLGGDGLPPVGVMGIRRPWAECSSSVSGLASHTRRDCSGVSRRSHGNINGGSPSCSFRVGTEAAGGASTLSPEACLPKLRWGNGKTPSPAPHPCFRTPSEQIALKHTTSSVHF